MMRRLVLMAAMLLAGCVNLEDPAPSQTTRLVVHGILDTHSGDQRVLVYRARTGLPTVVEGNSISEDEPVADALVSLTVPGGTTWPAGRFLTTSGECCVSGTYVFESAPVGPPMSPGAGYTLRIQTPAGEVVTGTTTIPGPRISGWTPRASSSDSGTLCD